MKNQCPRQRESRVGKGLIILGLVSDTQTYLIIVLNNLKFISAVIKHYKSRTVIHRDGIAIFAAHSTKALPPQTIYSWYCQKRWKRTTYVWLWHHSFTMIRHGKSHGQFIGYKGYSFIYIYKDASHFLPQLSCLSKRLFL